MKESRILYGKEMMQRSPAREHHEVIEMPLQVERTLVEGYVNSIERMLENASVIEDHQDFKLVTDTEARARLMDASIAIEGLRNVLAPMLARLREMDERIATEQRQRFLDTAKVKLGEKAQYWTDTKGEPRKLKTGVVRDYLITSNHFVGVRVVIDGALVDLALVQPLDVVSKLGDLLPPIDDPEVVGPSMDLDEKDDILFEQHMKRCENAFEGDDFGL